MRNFKIKFKIKKFVILLFLLLFVSTKNSFAMLRTNFYRPYDINFRMEDWPKTKFKLGVNIETGSTHNAKDSSEHKTNVLQIYNSTESTLAMLMGGPVNTDAYDLANYFLAAYGPALDDGVRGHLKLNGKFEQTEFSLWAKYRLPNCAIPGHFDLSLYLPIKYLAIKNVSITDQTKSILNADLDVNNVLTDDIKTVAQNLGGLSLDSWSKTGAGDLTLMLGWFNDFRQTKEYLENVKISAKLGITAPTGAKKDINKAFSLPMDNDGAWAIPLGGGVDLDFVHRIRAGLEFEMLFSFDEKRTRRMKTDTNQTDFLLLNSGRATRSPGFAWKFNLFLQARRFLGGLSFMTAYQFLKHDDDKLTADSNDFSYNIINSAQSLHEWGFQNFIFQFNYDFFNECKKSWFKPQISVFAKLPVAGKRVINAYTFGGQFALNF
ncbi:hypothetical protein K9M16_02885 [Candidatus Babeliales bacterium]|nr:hypothetical protein [Candidatus Babeliales bacterium]